MRIIYFSPHPTHDIVSDVGYSTHQREIIRALRNLGHEVMPVIIGGSSKQELPAATANQRPNRFVSIIKAVIPGYLWRTLKDARLMRHDRHIAGPRLRAAIEKYDPDLVYERSEYFLGQGASISAELGVKHIYEVNAPCVEEWLEFEGASFLTQKAEQCERLKMKHSSGFCPVSTPLGEYLAEHYQIQQYRIQVIPNAINLSGLKKETDRVAIRTKHGFKTTDIVIGFIGAILPYHGVQLLVEAFIDAYKVNPNLKLLVVGDGKLLADLKRMTTEASINESVCFSGRIKHDLVWDYISAMDICVNPKHSWYGSPIKTFEYGAMGRPIIAPDEGNMRDVLSHMNTAWLFDGSREGLNDAILNLSNDLSLREELGRAISRQIVEKNTWESNAERLIEFAKTL
jgi:glycosyltransferase involved in cell wall biosynthesis